MARSTNSRGAEPPGEPASRRLWLNEGLAPSPHVERAGTWGEDAQPGPPSRPRRSTWAAGLLVAMTALAIGGGLLVHYEPGLWPLATQGHRMIEPQPVAEPPPYSLRAAWRDVGRASQPTMPAASRSMADVPVVSVLEGAPRQPKAARNAAVPSGAALLAERMSSAASNQPRSALIETQAPLPPSRDARAPEPAPPSGAVTPSVSTPALAVEPEPPQSAKIPRQKEGRSALGGPMSTSTGTHPRKAPVANRRKPLTRAAPPPVRQADRQSQAGRVSGAPVGTQRRAVPRRRPQASVPTYGGPVGVPAGGETADGQPLGGTAVFQGLGRAMP